jgi:hypothetical protein
MRSIISSVSVSYVQAPRMWICVMPYVAVGKIVLVQFGIRVIYNEY